MLSSRILQTPRVLYMKPMVTAPRMLPRHFSSTPFFKGALLDTIRNDHKELEYAYNKVHESKTLPDKARWQNQFTWGLACHSIGEELVVYPAMERNVHNGKNMADDDRIEHHIVKEYLYTFQDQRPEDPGFLETLDALWAHLRQHVEHEESHDLPVLEGALSDTEVNKLASHFGRSKMFTPTRSHPNAPDKPPFETVAGLMAAPMDRLMDMFRDWPRTAGKQESARK